MSASKNGRSANSVSSPILEEYVLPALLYSPVSVKDSLLFTLMLPLLVDSVGELAPDPRRCIRLGVVGLTLRLASSNDFLRNGYGSSSAVASRYCRLLCGDRDALRAGALADRGRRDRGSIRLTIVVLSAKHK